METAMQILTLIGTLSTIILGVIAICLSLYFYRRSRELDISAREVLSDIKQSSKVVETSSRDIYHPVVETILSMVRDTTRTRIESVGQVFMLKSALKLEQLLKAQTTEEKNAARQSFIEEINSLLGTLSHEVGTVGLSSESEIRLATRVSPKEDVKSSPLFPSYNWAPFIRRMRDIDKTHAFLSVKWLRETKFANDPIYQEALQIAIDKKMLSTYYRDNPKRPEFPTLCCKLNRDNKMVKELLERLSGVSIEEKK